MTAGMDASWMLEAACRGKVSAGGADDVWFPDRAADPGRTVADLVRIVRAGLDACAECPVRLACLDWALAHDEQWGIWGGVNMTKLNGLKRRRLREERGVTVLPPRPRIDTLIECAGDLRRNRAAANG